MAQIPVKVGERLAGGIRRFQPILSSAKARDVNESDTVILVTDILSEIFGFDKYSEITSECSIRGTFCDLGIKINGAFQFLIEVKAIGLDLKDAFTKQAIDYSVNLGTEWVVLTNGEIWRVFKVSFTKPIDYERVLELNFSQLNPKNKNDIESLYHLTKEGWLKSALGDLHMQRQALDRFFLAATLLNTPVLEIIRREVRRLCPEVKIDTDQIKAVITQELLKREVVEGDKAEEAKRRLLRGYVKVQREKTSKEEKESIQRAGEDAAGQIAPGHESKQ